LVGFKRITFEGSYLREREKSRKRERREGVRCETEPKRSPDPDSDLNKEKASKGSRKGDRSPQFPSLPHPGSIASSSEKRIHARKKEKGNETRRRACANLKPSEPNKPESLPRTPTKERGERAGKKRMGRKYHKTGAFKIGLTKKKST